MVISGTSFEEILEAKGLFGKLRIEFERNYGSMGVIGKFCT